MTQSGWRCAKTFQKVPRPGKEDCACETLVRAGSTVGLGRGLHHAGVLQTQGCLFCRCLLWTVSVGFQVIFLLFCGEGVGVGWGVS